MSDRREFSVLLPVYRGDVSEYLEDSFRSVTEEQDLRPAQVVIVRDGPVGSALAATIERCVDQTTVPVTLVELHENVGLARALQAGLEACEHEIVARQDADDISRPHRFAVQVPMISGGLDMVGSAIEEFMDGAPAAGGPGGLVRVPPVSQLEIEQTSRFASPFNHPTVVFRRSAVAAAGGYQDLPLMEDYWLFARMVEAGAHLANVAEPLVLYRVGAGAYARRGGARLLRSELELQRRFRREGFTTMTQAARNVAVRGGYRLVPEPVRRGLYREWIRFRRSG